jgi:hypothetical protein
MNPNSVVKGLELQSDTLLQGIMTKLPSGVTTLLMRGVATPVADVVKEGQGLVQPYKDSRNAHTVIRQFAQSKPQIKAALKAFIADAKIAIAAVVGADNEAMTDFGFSLRKPAKKLTSEQNTLRAAKARLTRQKRGTLGKRQKAALKATETPNLSITFGPTPESSSSTPPSTQAPNATKP